MKDRVRLLPRTAGLAVAVAAFMVGARAQGEPARPSKGLVIASSADARLITVRRDKDQFKDNEPLVFYGLRAVAGMCGKLGIDIDGVEEERADVAFPLTLSVPRIARNYPKADGVHTLTLRGKSPNCTGSVTTTFNTRHTPPVDGNGKVTDLRVVGFATSAAKGQLEIKGYGSCRFHANIFDLSKHSQTGEYFKVIDPAVALPLTLDNIGPLGPGKYRAYLISYDDKKCPIQGPDAKAGGWYTDFTVVNAGYANQNGQSPSGGGTPAGGTPPPGGGSGGGTKPATGKVVAVNVPGGSFAEDDAQKIVVTGHGGCALDLAISNKSYGGSYDNTASVLPVKLDAGATLYNGTHFGTLAEGSYHATATGKSGCTGTAAIDFKVTAKTSTKKVLGKPTLGFDKQPKSGNAFSVSKDSNIWFKVTLPQSIKTEPNASCCDVEFDYQNEFGGWEPLPNSPFSDSSFVLAVTQAAGVVNKSVSGFKQGTHWRMKVRAYKFKTEFEWSDWVEFNVDQN